MPKSFNFRAAMHMGLIVPKNFLGKLECARILTPKEALEWEKYRKSKYLKIIESKSEQL